MRTSVVFGLAVLLAAFAHSSFANEQAAGAGGGASKTLRISDYQRDFLTVIADYSKQYEAESNELKKTAMEKKRRADLKALNGSPAKVEGWFGIIRELGTTRDGQAFLEVELPASGVVFKTMNNRYSDGRYATLIKDDSALYSALSEMAEGNVVRFAGSIGHALNTSEEARMTQPKYLFQFRDVVKVGDSAE